MAESCGQSMFSAIRRCQTVFQSACTVPRSCQQWMDPGRHLELSVFQTRQWPFFSSFKTFYFVLEYSQLTVNPKGNQSWIFIGKTDAEAEAPIPWSPDAKNWLIGKDTNAGKDWRQEEKGATDCEMVGWHHWLDSHESEQDLGVGDGQGSLVCCWGRKESDTTERRNW